ncbi:MAG: cobalamin biosynthesis protein CbiM [Desulfobacteraceae bacterium]|nr:cobalamin biosynthesis protein CbiM [Desulfobacteraceae bacterium]
MHMADALLSPAVGGTMWAATAGLIVYCSKKVREDLDEKKIPLMGVIGAFIFAAQMINFTIPATGSSGHLGGAMILAILLGPYAAFLTMASVLTVQALFFADGGLLALGCNIVNMGFFPCFICYPLIYKTIVKGRLTPKWITTGAIISAIIGLQLGAFSVVLETFFSGISALPFSHFLLLMQPIHLAIGIVEGLTTAAVVIFIWKSRPEILQPSISVVQGPGPDQEYSIKKVFIGFAAAAIIVGCGLSWFASAHPDGLEWAISKTTGMEELGAPQKNLYSSLTAIQEKTAFLPDYGFKTTKENPITDTKKAWPAVDSGTSVSGLVGGLLTLCLAIFIGFIIKRKKTGQTA